MKQTRPLVALSLAMAAVLETVPAGGAFADGGTGQLMTPDSSLEQPDDVGVNAHTNIKLFIPDEGLANVAPPDMWGPNASSPPVSGLLFETPASVGCAYRLTKQTGCNPNIVTANPRGGSRAIAIVDAYHYATAVTDLINFSQQFGLPLPTSATFQVVFANGQPPTNSGWNILEALDIEWVHAMAPKATIYLVEAFNNSFTELLKAVDVANSLVTANFGGEVSMSWGGSEFAGETSLDGHFQQPGVVHFAASGDSPGVIWPSASPFVVSVGGAGLSHDLSNGNFQAEVIWQRTGGGPSKFYARPAYQASVANITGNQRGTPDVSAIADPATGVWVYCSTISCQAGGVWLIVGGTSVATPVSAGIVNSANHFFASTNTELTSIYQNMTNTTAFRDITFGSCGPYEGYFGLVGYDLCTGVGSPTGKLFK
jgi:subtilase family serine protease